MALSVVDTDILWSSATSLSVTNATEVVSDPFTVDPTTYDMSVTVTADNSNGAPSAGDTAVFRVRWSTDGGTTYDTAEHAQYIGTLDTVAANTPGEDPARRTFNIGRCGGKLKIACICAQAATHAITISAKIEEQRAA